MRVLARPVDVGVAERNVRETLLHTVEVHVALPGEFRDTVGRDRVLWVVFWDWELMLFAVNRPPVEAKTTFPTP